MSEHEHSVKINEVVSFDEKCNPPSKERILIYPPSRERNTTSRESERENNRSRGESRGSSRDGTDPPSSREGMLFAEKRKRAKSVYAEHQSIKPLNTEYIIQAQKRISLNPAYTIKKLDKNALHEKLVEKVRLTKACHRPVTVPLAKIVGKIPEYVDVSELLGLRRAFTELQKDYHKIVEARRYNVHRRHVELMEIDKITSTRLRQRFIETLRAYGISASVISDVLEELPK